MALQHQLQGSSLTFSSISMAVRFVVSKFSTSAVSSRNSPPAADSRASSESSSSFSRILNSFWLFVRFACDTSAPRDASVTRPGETLPSTTVCFGLSLMCWCTRRVDVAPLGTPCPPQGEAVMVPVAGPGSAGQWWTRSCPRTPGLGARSALEEQQ